MPGKILTLTLVLAFLPRLRAQDFPDPQMSAADLQSGSGDFDLPDPEKSAEDVNYYLERNSYDPLLKRSYPESKINVIGGTIDIPGMEATLDFARKYRQKGYAVSDLQGDVALTVYTKNLPKILFRILFGIAEDGGSSDGASKGPGGEELRLPTEEEIMAQDIPQEEKERLLIQLKNSKMMLEGRVNPFKVKEMKKMYMQVMKEEAAAGIQPQLGTPHAWSPEFMTYCREKGEMIPLTFTKLLTALASGVTSRFFVTGREEALTSYILSRPEESVTMDEMFRQSYRLNDGEVYLSLLTIENILSANWRNPERDELPVTKKLSNICNFYQGKGDKFGAWYHFHGIMLYGYVRGGLRAAIVGGIESAGSHVLNGPNDQDEQQEDYVNSTGGKIGAKLAKAMKKGEHLTFTPDKNYADPKAYLNLNEDFRDRIEIYNSRDFDTTLSFERLWIKSVVKDYKNCRVEVMYNDHTGDLNSRRKVIREGVSILKGKQFVVAINSFDPVKKARAFINCDGMPEQAVEDFDPWAENDRSKTADSSQITE